MANLKRTLYVLLVFATLIALRTTDVHAADAKAKPAKAAKADPAKAAASPSPAAPTPSPTPEASPSPSPSATPSATPVEEVKEEAKPAEEKKDETKKELYGKKNRNLGDFVVGPFIHIVSIPRPLGFGVEAKWNDILGVSAGYGFIPQITLDGVKVKLTGYDARLKFYPFKGAFFIGVGIGSQVLTGSKVETIATVPVTASVSLTNNFVSPQLGWNWIWDSGFFFGLDLGVQLTLKNTGTVTSDAPAIVQATAEYTALQNDVQKAADMISKYPIPLLTLIKIGYFF